MYEDFLVKTWMERDKKMGSPYTIHDQELMEKMCKEINDSLSCSIKLEHISQFHHYHIIGSGEIVKNYVKKFDSEYIRAELMLQMVHDHIEGCAELIYEMYLNFKESEWYLTGGVEGSLYDNAFWRLKPKRLRKNLVDFAYYPRDVYYLPLTIRMLCSWKLPEMEERLYFYADEMNITAEMVGLSSDGTERNQQELSWIRRQTSFLPFTGLKYYPSEKAEAFIQKWLDGSDKDKKMAAIKTYKYWKKRGIAGSVIPPSGLHI